MTRAGVSKKGVDQSVRWPVLVCATLLFGTSLAAYAQIKSGNWEELRAGEKDKSPYVSRVIEYKPAPGQFINVSGIGTPEAAESIAGGIRGLVSLGGFGGYIVVEFDHTILNDPANPYGVDFTIVGNAVANSSEPGAVMVMADTNGNGLPDDTWYELKGSSYDSASTAHRYSLTYTNPHTAKAADIPWKDNAGNVGAIHAVPTFHAQSYYPDPDIFPDYPQDEVSFAGTRVDLRINTENSAYIRIPALPFGYADNYLFLFDAPPYLPDDPRTFDVREGNGGNAFDIDWAGDEDGNPVHLEGIDFIKIYTAVNANAGRLGEISTEVCGVVDVAPDGTTSTPDPLNTHTVKIYPNPASEYLKIQSDGIESIQRVEIYNMSGNTVYVNSDIGIGSLTVPIRDYPAGVYLVCVYEGDRKIIQKVIITP